jgi:hypothetical protein
MTKHKGVFKMGNEASKEQATQLSKFIEEVRENFQSAGKPKSGWLRNLLKKLFS